MYKARISREANNAYVKDYLKDTQGLKNKTKTAVIGIQNDHN